MEILTFFKGKKGNIISRLPSGKIALVNRNNKVQPKPGEKWVCKIDFEKENFAVVTPITRIVRKPVYDKTTYKCGHVELKKLWEEEMPEDTPEPVIKFKEFKDELCPECKKHCKHENTEFEVDLWDFGLIVQKVCIDCKKILDRIDFSDIIDENKGFFGTDFNKVREAVKQRISDPELQRKVMAELDREEQYVKEYSEMCRRENEIKEQIAKLMGDLKKTVAKHFSDFREALESVKVHKDYIEYCCGSVNVPEKCLGIGIGGRKLYEYSTTPVYKKVKIHELPEEIQEIVRKINELREELDKVEQWLIENRPIE